MQIFSIQIFWIKLYLNKRLAISCSIFHRWYHFAHLFPSANLGHTEKAFVVYYNPVSTTKFICIANENCVADKNSDNFHYGCVAKSHIFITGSISHANCASVEMYFNEKNVIRLWDKHLFLLMTPVFPDMKPAPNE